MSDSRTTRRRATYHHGDLRAALLQAGIELAREQGPEAVVLREATRRVGVSPNAAYRHFADRDALLDAVCDSSQARLAEWIERRQAEIPDADPATTARARLRAIGTAYVEFAVEEPGLFRAAFRVPADLERAHSPERAGSSGRTPFELVNAALDDFVSAGIMPAHRREHAEVLAWSAVHGLAGLVTEGPLRALPRQAVDALTQRVIDMVEAGLTAPVR